LREKAAKSARPGQSLDRVGASARTALQKTGEIAKTDPPKQARAGFPLGPTPDGDFGRWKASAAAGRRRQNLDGFHGAGSGDHVRGGEHGRLEPALVGRGVVVEAGGALKNLDLRRARLDDAYRRYFQETANAA